MNKFFYTVGVFVLISFAIFSTACRAPMWVPVVVPAHTEFTAEDYNSKEELPPKTPTMADVDTVSVLAISSDDATFFTPPSKFNYMRWVKGQLDTPLPNNKWRRITKWYVPSRSTYQKYVWNVIGRDYCGRSIFGWTPEGIPVEEDLVTMPNPETTRPPKLY